MLSAACCSDVLLVWGKPHELWFDPNISAMEIQSLFQGLECLSQNNSKLIQAYSWQSHSYIITTYVFTPLSLTKSFSTILLISCSSISVITCFFSVLQLSHYSLSLVLFISHYFVVVIALISVFPFSNSLEMFYLSQRSTGNSLEAGARSAYTLSSPYPTCRITLDMLLLLKIDQRHKYA